MRNPADVNTRALMVLTREADRMKDAAERVRLVVQAMALRRGIRPTQVAELAQDGGYDFGA